MNKKILITGGTGFIGSHTCCVLLEAGYEVVIIDNFSNSSADIVEKIKETSGKNVAFYEGDVTDKNLLKAIFTKENIDVVIHFAAYKAVGESVKLPLKYYRNNLDSTLTLLEVMEEVGCKRLVFSSSATVYGIPKTLPIKEDAPLSTTNPYGTTKWMIEKILKDVYQADHEWSIAILRYFNPIGAHPSAKLGENPNDIPNNLMPYIMKVATKELEYLSIFGNDYETRDGTGVRDYIHVMDLAKGHEKAVEKVLKEQKLDCYNLGTGKGYSVLEVVNTFEKVNHVKIPYKIVKRRKGDIAECYADPSYAEKQLKFKAEKSLEEMCRDAYHYIKANK